MKKILLALALLGLVVLGVWGFRAVRQSFSRGVELVEGDVPACHVVFGAEVKPGEKSAGDRQKAVAEALKSAGVTPGSGFAMWVKEGGGLTMRTGLQVRAEDFPKVRALRGETLAVAFPAQRGWIAREMPEGGFAAAMAMPRFTSSAMEKAKSLGLTSYCMFMNLDGVPARTGLVRAPR